MRGEGREIEKDNGPTMLPRNQQHKQCDIFFKFHTATCARHPHLSRIIRNRLGILSLESDNAQSRRDPELVARYILGSLGERFESRPSIRRHSNTRNQSRRFPSQQPRFCRIAIRDSGGEHSRARVRTAVLDLISPKWSLIG